MKTSTHIVEEDLDPETGALTYPIYQTSAYLLPKGEKYRYSRESNPTVEALSNKMARIEECPSGSAFSSGMGAITSTLLSLLEPGSRLLIGSDVFARSFRFSVDFLTKWGIRVDIAEPGTENVVSGIQDDTDLVFVEGITNPALRVNDVAKISRAARKTGSKLIVDSTFTTPVNQKPYLHGADLVIHSASKFLAGHNDVIAGIAVGEEDLVKKADMMRRTLGSSLDPHAAFLVLRGLKTLRVRMEAINKAAMELAKYLEEKSNVIRVHYPGLKSHPDHSTAVEVLEGFGGVVTFELDGNEKDALEFMSRLKLIMPANTLGGVNSTISHPKTMSHRGLNDQDRKRVGISDTMLRLSVGLEHFEDLTADIEQAS